MGEVLSILFALGALVLGLLVSGWAFGDFEPPPGVSTQEQERGKPTSP